MAKTNAILGPDRSAATTVALVVLCALGLVELGSLVRSGWRSFRPDPVVKPVPPTVAVAGAPVVAAAPVVTVPATPKAASPSVPVGKAVPAPAPAPAPAPKVTAAAPVPVPARVAPEATRAAAAAALPPLPSMTTGGANGLPPLPDLKGTGLKPVPLSPRPVTAATPTVRPLAVASVSPQAMASMVPPSAPRQPVPGATPSIPKTGKPQVDELIDVAAQSRELGDGEGALQALERADLMAPDNAIVLREKALTLSKMGQVVKAQQLWDRINRLGPGAGIEAAPAPSAPPVPGQPESGLGSAFASLNETENTKGPIWLGNCQTVPDLTAVKGQRVLLKIPVLAKPGASIGVDDWNLDILFYDRVDGARVEPTKADPVTYTSDVDGGGNMVVSAVYHMPEMTPQMVANVGHREFYGYIVKLYYQHRLMSTAASPRDLLNNPGGPGATATPAANPLLPLPRP